MKLIKKNYPFLEKTYGGTKKKKRAKLAELRRLVKRFGSLPKGQQIEMRLLVLHDDINRLYNERGRNPRQPDFEMAKMESWNQFAATIGRMKEFTARLKDRDFAAKLDKLGGVCQFLEDYKHQRVIWVWVGKTEAEVDQIVEGMQANAECEAARKIILENAKILDRHGDDFGRLIIDTLSEAI